LFEFRTSQYVRIERHQFTQVWLDTGRVWHQSSSAVKGLSGSGCCHPNSLQHFQKDVKPTICEFLVALGSSRLNLAFSPLQWT
jgi:hypothetical protein